MCKIWNRIVNFVSTTLVSLQMEWCFTWKPCFVNVKVSCEDPENFLGGNGGGGGFQLQIRVVPTKFYHFETHTLENRVGDLDPRSPTLDPHVSVSNGNSHNTLTDVACHVSFEPMQILPGKFVLYSGFKCKQIADKHFKHNQR